jgi:hypothetical protein
VLPPLIIPSKGRPKTIEVMSGYHHERPQAFLSKPDQMSKVNQVIHRVLAAVRQSD